MFIRLYDELSHFAFVCCLRSRSHKCWLRFAIYDQLRLCTCMLLVYIIHSNRAVASEAFAKSLLTNGKCCEIVGGLTLCSDKFSSDREHSNSMCCLFLENICFPHDSRLPKPVCLWGKCEKGFLLRKNCVFEEVHRTHSHTFFFSFPSLYFKLRAHSENLPKIFLSLDFMIFFLYSNRGLARKRKFW